MQNDLEVLKQLNIEIGDLESSGDKKAYERLAAEILAPELAFRRADGTTFDNRQEFLDKLKPSAKRETEVESIHLYGDRAVVTCIVTMESKRYHNIRLFIRHEKNWKLLGWANQRL